MSAHTPEPWAVPSGAGLDGGNMAELFGANDQQIGLFVPACKRKPGARNKADLSRIVDCVNACAGIDDPAAGVVPLTLHNERLDDCSRLTSHRNSLLAALREIVAEPWSPYCSTKLQMIANNAIAGVES